MLTRGVGYLSDYYGEPLVPKEKAVTVSLNAGTYTATVADGYTIDQENWVVNGVPVAGATSLTWTPSAELNAGDVVTFSYNIASISTPPITVVATGWTLESVNGWTLESVNGWTLES